MNRYGKGSLHQLMSAGPAPMEAEPNPIAQRFTRAWLVQSSSASAPMAHRATGLQVPSVTRIIVNFCERVIAAERAAEIGSKQSLLRFRSKGDKMRLQSTCAMRPLTPPPQTS